MHSANFSHCPGGQGHGWRVRNGRKMVCVAERQPVLIHTTQCVFCLALLCLPTDLVTLNYEALPTLTFLGRSDGTERSGSFQAIATEKHKPVWGHSIPQ